MTRQEWLAEVCRRIGISEGVRTTMYRDSLGIQTIGIGFNLTRVDAMHALIKAGVAPGDLHGVMTGTVALTSDQVDDLFEYSFAPIESEARASLEPGIFDAMTDARRFVIVDLVFNLGAAGWFGFSGTRALLAQAQKAKNAGDADAHLLFEEAANHLTASAWFGQVGDRARRDVAMIRSGVFVDATGNGSP